MDDQICKAANQFKKAIEDTGRSNVVIIYSYLGKRESDKANIVFTRHIADNFMHVLGVCDLVRHDLLNGNEQG
ncbi:MAG: hypothetical protein V4549_03560 [Bacteroidota bacterium]